MVVVGGGISGLAAAWELTGGGAGRHADGPIVTLLEASPRLGGPLRSEMFGGRVVDMGPDGFLGRRPEAVDAVPRDRPGRRLGPHRRARCLRLGRGGVCARCPFDTRSASRPGSGRPCARGRWAPPESLGLARDALLPRPDVRGPIGDRSIGPLVTRKLGKQVVDTLVDPLLGGIHAGTVDDMSAAATFPPLLAAAQRRGSLMRALRAEVPPTDESGTPLFWSLHGGMASLVDALADALRARGVDLRLSTRVDVLQRAGRRWRVRYGDMVVDADGVVLATPAPATATLLQPHDHDVAGLLEAIDYSSAVVATFRVASADVPDLVGTGFLVPRHSPHKGRDAWAITACTFLDRKWPRLVRDGEVLLRASLGRIDDTRPQQWEDGALLARAWEELAALMGLAGAPLESTVVRHANGLPQYRVHHLLRTAGVESAVARLGGLTVAGAAYHGVGIPACVASGRAAARSLL